MSISRLIIGDSSIARFWSAAQLSRRELSTVSMKEASCLETLASALSEVTDSLDFVLVAILSDMIIEEASAADVTASCNNIITEVMKSIARAARKSSNVQVIVGFFFFLYCISRAAYYNLSVSFLFWLRCPLC